VAREIPLVGFYLQPAVGGIVLPASFWCRFAAIENVVAIKIAPFNRYRTLDVVRGVVEAGAADRITLYTGNDDHIVLDLVTPFTVMVAGKLVTVRIKGGLLGHWSVWVKPAVELLARIHAAIDKGPIAADLLALDAQVTDCNAAIFDVANDFHGVICGCHEILRRQGLLEGIWCLDPNESLGPGQMQEIDRVCAAYPHLNDDAFVRANVARWLA
jgi:dihydrodipicolinate synthase/N-acetylneuraminate lyase